MRKLRKREKTEAICVYIRNYQAKSFEEVNLEAYKTGYLFFPFHYMIEDDGEVKQGRELEAVGSYDLQENAVNIVVDAIHSERVNAVQTRSLNNLLTELQEKYPEAKVVFVDEK